MQLFPFAMQSGFKFFLFALVEIVKSKNESGDELENLFKMIDEIQQILANGRDDPTNVPDSAFEQIWKKVDKKVRKMIIQPGQREKEKLCSAIQSLTKKFIDYLEIERAYAAIYCEFCLIKRFYETSLHKLQKLQQLGVSMQQVINAEKKTHIDHKTDYD